MEAYPAVVLVKVREALGSTPREAGAWMLVAPDATFGTIGGGQLEFMAIDEARRMLAGKEGAAPHPPFGHLLPAGGEKEEAGTLRQATFSPRAGRRSRQGDEGRVALSVPLGPEIGQCCGGRVELMIELIDEAMREEMWREDEREAKRRPHVYLFGGGHVGHALARALILLPVTVTVVETRAEALEGLPDGVVPKLTAVPEEAVRGAPAGSAFVILTHDHALDFLILAEALKRKDAAYVGMIGSTTKKATFRNWYLKTAGGTEDAFARLITPIGGAAVKDKRPAVIAALAAAEIIEWLLAYEHPAKHR